MCGRGKAQSGPEIIVLCVAAGWVLALERCKLLVGTARGRGACDERKEKTASEVLLELLADKPIRCTDAMIESRFSDSGLSLKRPHHRGYVEARATVTLIRTGTGCVRRLDPGGWTDSRLADLSTELSTGGGVTCGPDSHEARRV